MLKDNSSEDSVSEVFYDKFGRTEYNSRIISKQSIRNTMLGATQDLKAAGEDKGSSDASDKGRESEFKLSNIRKFET